MKGVLVLLSFLLLMEPAAVSQSSNYLVHGILTRDGTTEPIAGAQMTLQASTPLPTETPRIPAAAARGAVAPRPTPATFTAMTDSGGRFQLRAVPAGRYSLRAQKDGYFAVPPVPAIGVLVDSSTPGKEVSISLIRSTVLTGHLRDVDGMPLTNRTIDVLTRRFAGEPALDPAASGQTDDRGEYRIFGLRPDLNYYLAIRLSRQQLPTRGTTVIQDSLIFYPDTVEPSMATPIRLSANAELTTLDLTLHAPKTYSVSGIVRAPAGVSITKNAPPFPVFYLQRQGLRVAGQTTYTRNVSADITGGVFELRDVLPGTYDLYSMLQNRPNSIVGRTTIQVTDHDLNDVMIDLKPGADLVVRVVSVDARFTVPQGLSISLVSPDIPSEFPIVRFSAANSPATYAAANVPDGRYEVRVTGIPPDFFLSDVRTESAGSVIDSGLIVANGESQSIQLQFTRGIGAVRGVIVDAAGNPASGRVTLTPPIAMQQARRLFHAPTTGLFGEFSFTNIPPGEYRLFAFDGHDMQNIWDAEVRTKYEPRGVKVIVTAGSTVSVQVPVIR